MSFTSSRLDIIKYQIKYLFTGPYKSCKGASVAQISLIAIN